MSMPKIGALLFAVRVVCGAENALSLLSPLLPEEEGRLQQQLKNRIAEYMEMWWDEPATKVWFHPLNEEGVHIRLTPELRFLSIKRTIELGRWFYALETSADGSLSLSQKFMLDVAFKRTQLQEAACQKASLAVLAGLLCAVGGNYVASALGITAGCIIGRKMEPSAYDYTAINTVCRSYETAELREIKQSYERHLLAYSPQARKVINVINTQLIE